MIGSLLFPCNLALSLTLFSLGAIGFLWKRDAVSMSLCASLMLNAALLALVAFARELGDPRGLAMACFVIVVAVAQSGAGLAVLLVARRVRNHLRVDDMDELKE